MKYFLLLLCFISVLQARLPEKGESVFVELKSGIKQKAEFAGFNADTVLLGGYIKNEYAIVKIPKTSFVQIISSANGDTLSLEELPDSVLSISDSTKINDSLLTDSSFNANILSAFENKTILVPFSKRPIDSSFAISLQNLFYDLLKEDQQDPVLVTDSILENCIEISCSLPLLRKLKPKAILFGSILPSTNDSLRLELSYFSNEGEPEEASINISAKNPFSQTLEGSPIKQALNTLFKKVPELKKQADTIYIKPEFNYVFVETEPEGALLTLAKGNSICKTPCTYATKDTGTVELYAYWDVDEHLWAETIKTRILPDDTTKISMRLQRVQPKIQIVSHPEGAEIFLNDTITRFTASLGKTPKILNKNTLGESSLFLSKEGFRDTTIHFYIMPSEKNKIDITLTPLTLPSEINDQQKERKKRLLEKVGITLIGTSVVPAVIGGVFAYLSAKDYEKAKDIRDELKKPHIANGSNYDKQIKENKKYADRSDERAYVSITSFAVAIGLLGAGIVISF